MKKIAFVSLFAIITFTYAFAGDVIKVLSVYSGGVRTTIPLAAIDSLDQSKYDADSILQSNYTSSIIHAFDRDYQLPIANIDSIVIDEIDIQEYDAQINEISDFIDQQTELEINAFQTNLMSWLNAKENIPKATINEDKDFITIKFKNGLDFYIDFQDMSFYESIEEESVEANTSPRRANDNNNDYYNVSEQQGEIIIDSPKVLYIQGMNMRFSYAEDEKEELEELLYFSPIKFDLKPYNNSLLFLDEVFSEYGLIIVSQTHGAGNHWGAFKVEDRGTDLLLNDHTARHFFNKRGLQIYFVNKENIEKVEQKPFFWITPELVSKKLKTSNAIFYGSYCYSTGLSEWLTTRNTFFGYSTRSGYFNNTKYLIKFISNMVNGIAFMDAIQPLKSYETTLFDVYPYTNNPSKQRYFSISTDNITKKMKTGIPSLQEELMDSKNCVIL